MGTIGVKEAYESAQDRLCGMSLEQFEYLVKDFEVTPVFYDNSVIGAIFVKENNVHACIKKEYKGKWFGRIAVRIISRIVKEYGEAITSATTPDGIKIVEALGFVKDGEIYRSTRRWE